jgi:hypothetical protein
MNRCTYTNEVGYSESLWVYLEVLFESFYLTKLLNMAVVRNIEVILGQTLNHSVQSSVLLCSVVSVCVCLGLCVPS